MEDWEAVEVKMVLVEMGTEQGMADALVEARLQQGCGSPSRVNKGVRQG